MITDRFTKLGFLLEQFNLTQRELADALYIHYTMVSKWINGKRILSSRSPYLKKIVNYFIALDSNIKFSRLKQILLYDYPHAQLNSRDEIYLFLRRWLLEEDHRHIKNDLLLKINADKDVCKSEFYIFKGNSGRRKAVEKIADISNSLPKGQETLLFSQEDNTWFYEDKEFLKLWKEKNFEFLQREGKINIIHTLDRSNKSNAFSLLYWLPFDISPGTFPYLHAHFLENTNTRFTLFILKNVAALFGFTSGITTKTLYTYMIFDSITLQKLQLAMENLLKYCTPMFDKSFPNEHEKIINLITIATMNKEDNYCFTLPPSLRIISSKLFREILLENDFNKTEVELYLNYHSTLQKNFYADSRECVFRFIYDINKLEKALESDCIYFEECSLFMNRTLKITRKTLIKSIEETIKAMEKMPNLKIALVEEPPDSFLENINICVKKDTISIFNKSVSKNQPTFSLFTHEPTAVNSYFYFFNQLWNSIPSLKRDPKWVIKRLISAISIFK